MHQRRHRRGQKYPKAGKWEGKRTYHFTGSEMNCWQTRIRENQTTSGMIFPIR